MANKKKPEGTSLSTEDIIELIADRRNFTKADVREIISELKDIFEECILKDVEIDLNGFIHMKVVRMNYKKTPGIIRHRGLTDFVSNTKRISYTVPLNFRKMIRKKVLDEKEEQAE